MPYSILYTIQNSNTPYITVLDPGFPVGGVDLIGGCVDSQDGYISQILYVKMKESGPLGGVHWAHPL